jgi:hypothetical protein
MLPANDASCLFVESQGGLEVVRLCRTRGSGRGLTAQAARSEPTRKKSSNWCQRRCVRIAAWSGEKAGAAKRDLRSDGPAGPAGASVADAAVQAFTLPWDGSGFPSRPVSLCLLSPERREWYGSEGEALASHAVGLSWSRTVGCIFALMALLSPRLAVSATPSANNTAKPMPLSRSAIPTTILPTRASTPP